MANQAKKDPVCGMDVNPNQNQHKTEHAGKQYAFCSEQCKEKFKKNPNQYTHK